MVVVTLVAIGLILMAVAVFAGRWSTVLSNRRLTPVRSSTSPVDEAERILARRYIAGEISVREYERMTHILRR